MSVVAPTRNIPSPLRILKWGATQKESKTVEFPFEEAPMTPLSPKIPIKSPERKKFFPLPTATSSEEKKYTAKTLPNTPTKPPHSHVNTPSLHTPSFTRSNTRLSSISTAVESASSGTASPSTSANMTTPFPPPSATVHTTSSPLTTTSTTATPAVQTRARSQSTTSQLRRPQTGTTPPPFQASSTRLPNPGTQQSPNPTNPLSPQTPTTTSPRINKKQPQTTTQRLREGAFFAFVLLPLSCWYTRGGKRLKELDMREVEEGRDARARANALTKNQIRERESEDDMRMPPRAAVGRKIGRRMSLDGQSEIRERQMQMKKLSSDDLGMKRVKTFASSPSSEGGGRAQTPEFRKQTSMRFEGRRDSVDDVGGRRRAGSLGANGIFGAVNGNGNWGHARSRSLKHHPDFDFDRKSMPLVRRTTTTSALIGS